MIEHPMKKGKLTEPGLLGWICLLGVPVLIFGLNLDGVTALSAIIGVPVVCIIIGYLFGEK